MKVYFVILPLLLFGCSSSDITSSKDIVFPADSISFGRYVEPLFSLVCNNCHSGTQPSGGIDLSSWYGVGGDIRVVNQPGDTTCNLILVVFGRKSHSGAININENQRQG